MGENLEKKYESVLGIFPKANRAGIAKLLEVCVNYIKYKYENENINFKTSACYAIAKIYCNKKTVSHKEIYNTIDRYHPHFSTDMVDNLVNTGTDEALMRTANNFIDIHK